jgi:hypothetical protein
MSHRNEHDNYQTNHEKIFFLLFADKFITARVEIERKIFFISEIT